MKKDKKLKKKELKQKRVEKQQQKQEKKLNRQALLPLIKTLVLWLVVVSLIRIEYSDHSAGLENQVIVKSFIKFTGWSVIAVAKLFFLSVEMVQFDLISVNNFTMRIAPECTIFDYYIFVIALAIFARWTIKYKILNALIIIAILCFINALRFIIMSFVGKYYPAAFDPAHDYLWNILFAFITFGLWLWRNNRSEFISSKKELSKAKA